MAIASLRSPAIKPVAVKDHQATMKLWAKRHLDPGRAPTQLVCRLDAVLCDLVPGGISKERGVGKENKVLAGIGLRPPRWQALHQLAPILGAKSR